MEKARLIIIEDNRLLRDGIVAMIKEQSDMLIAAVLDNNERIEKKILEANADIALIDLSLHGKNSLELVRMAKKQFPSIKFIVMDLLPIGEDIFEFVKAGASGFILKDATVNEFLKTIRSVFQGEKILPPDMTGSLFSQIVTKAVSTTSESKLIQALRMTKRERQVIELVADGLTNKEIGHQLHLSPFTVKSHVHNILEKLTMHNRIEIAKFAHTEKSFNDIKNSIAGNSNIEK
ncbi:MAG: response regulator transcription factor [bacterium]|nr:response regulator transcription factor [bacterium]